MAVASVAAALRAMPASVDQCCPSVRACAARSSWLAASDSESLMPAAGMRLVALPASATAVPSPVTVNAAPAGA